MKKVLIFLTFLVIILAGCDGMISGGGELTFEQVQQFAQQTMTARVVEADAGNPANSEGLLIRPVQNTPAAMASGVTILDTPSAENEGVIQRPVFEIPDLVSTEVPYEDIPVIQHPTVSYSIPNYIQQPTPDDSIYAKPVNTVCERVRFIDDITIPDDTVMLPGQNFRKVWRIQNAGSCAWTSGYQLVYSGGDPMGKNYAVNLPGPVAPGATVDVSIDLTAPNAYGKFQSNWKIRSTSGNIFGTSNSENDAIWAKIVVANNANMATVAPGVTPVNTGCALVSVVPAYRASFSMGEETDFIFRVRNTSGQLWSAEDLDIAYISGENMLKRKDQTRKDMTQDVPPNGIYQYTLDAVVPSTPGVYTMTMGVVRGYEIICTMDVTVSVVY